MLSRETILSGAYLRGFPDLPGQPRWSIEQIEASMHATLAQRPDDSPVWLFGYGSLIWNPQIHFQHRQEAILPGWHRSFCLRLLAGRGCPQYPGRMLALQSGGKAQGVIYELDETTLRDELRFVWVREMVYGSYIPSWVPVHLPCGKTRSALVFIADPSHVQYQGDTSVATISPLIATASGPMGTIREYLLSLEKTLATYGIVDPYIQELASAVRALTAA